jgi:hypothetical protein
MQLLEEMRVDLGRFMDLHFLRKVSVIGRGHRARGTHHLEVVQLLLDLLGQERGQSVARRDVPPSVILATRPRFMEPNARAEDQTLRQFCLRRGHIGARKSSIRQEVVIPSDLHTIVPLISRPGLVFGGTGDAGVRRVTTIVAVHSGRGNHGVRLSLCTDVSNSKPVSFNPATYS